MPTQNDEIAKKCCTTSSGGDVQTAVDIVEKQGGEYRCNNTSAGSMPTQAQAPSTVSPFGNLK